MKVIGYTEKGYMLDASKEEIANLTTSVNEKFLAAGLGILRTGKLYGTKVWKSAVNNSQTLEKTYDKSLEVGTNSVIEFINNVLPKLDLNKDDLKTTRFSIEHKTETDYKTDKKKDLGYQFEQN